MPHLRFRALPQKSVEEISLESLATLSELVGTPQENFTFELINTTYFSQGEVTQGDPFVEVLWFPRSLDIQDRTAQYLTDLLKKKTPAKDIIVVFTTLTPRAYYENSQSF